MDTSTPTAGTAAQRTRESSKGAHGDSSGAPNSGDAAANPAPRSRRRRGRRGSGGRRTGAPRHDANGIRSAKENSNKNNDSKGGKSGAAAPERSDAGSPTAHSRTSSSSSSRRRRRGRRRKGAPQGGRPGQGTSPRSGKSHTQRRTELTGGAQGSHHERKQGGASTEAHTNAQRSQRSGQRSSQRTAQHSAHRSPQHTQHPTQRSGQRAVQHSAHRSTQRRSHAPSMPVSNEVSAGGVVASGLAEAVDERGRVDLSQVYVALIGRLDKRGRLLWSMPKGHVEEGEDHASTAEREVWEETGVYGDVLDKLGVIDYWFISDGVRIHKTVHHYLLAYRDGDLNDDDPEVTEVAWIPAHSLVEKLAYSDERKLARTAHTVMRRHARRLHSEGQVTPR